MDSVKNVELTNAYDKCKYIVKRWENNFKKSHGRLPSRLDIKEASGEVRTAYKTYFKLKTAALEESLTNIEGFNIDVGDSEQPNKDAIACREHEMLNKNAEINNKINPKDTWGLHLNNLYKSENLKNKQKTEEGDVNLSFTNKLFQGSKNSKKLTRKSLSFNRKKTHVDSNNKPKFSSQPDSLSISLPENITSSSLVDNVFENNSNIKIITATPVVLSQPVNIIQNEFNSGNQNKPLMRVVDQGWVERLEQNSTNEVKNGRSEAKAAVAEVNSDSDNIIDNSDDDYENSCSLSHIAKKRKVSGTSMYESKEEHDDNSTNKLVTVDTSTKRLDFSNIFNSKQETITKRAPRFTIIKQVISKKKTETSSEGTDKNVQPTTKTTNVLSKEEQKLQQKIDSGTLNDNFVRIDLKKKVYVRGRKTKSFSNYKKQMWKKKQKSLCGPDMDMGGCDGGMLTCFNCGKVGHFARTCKLAEGDQLLPLEEDTEECVYPTLEEAAKMAKVSTLAIRKPNVEHGETEELEGTTNSEVWSELNQLLGNDDDLALLKEVERIETEIAKIDVQKYVDSTTHVQPYYSLAENNSLIDTPKEVFDTLKLFGHDDFRSGQEQAVMRILSGKSTLVTLSTGSGKSLCYQLPAYLYSKREPCISLIISPLVSLMEDQVTGIHIFLKAACLHTNQTKVQREKIMDAIKTGNINILLVSPEAVVAGERSSGFGSLIPQLPPIAFACIDEVHCVSNWSHNFRPSYLKICKVLKNRLGVKTILGLTATATRATCDSIIDHIGVPDGRTGHISDIPIPSNLKLMVSKDEQRDEALLRLLLSEPYVNYKSIIVYCTRREECQRVAAFLRTGLKDESTTNTNKKKRKRQKNFQAECYHAGMAASRRKSIQKAFMSGELRIVVATVAFGMGINKADIRSVIHYNMPMSFESYVQEVGRAGRDGLPAHCHLFLDAQGKNENELRRHIYANSTDRRTIRKLIQLCFVPCSCKSVCPKHEVAISIEDTVQALDIPEENIETLLCYLELHDKRYIELLSHAYITCKIVSYGGPNEITKAAKQCAPLAMALALYKKQDNKPNTVFEFPVIEVSSAMGWDSGICKHILKNLEWINENNKPRRSKLSVQFSNLGLRLLSPGNLSPSELDETLDHLEQQAKEQERMSLFQLHAFHSVLTSVTTPSFKESLIQEENNDKQALLKTKIREYFECPKPLGLSPEINTLPVNEDAIISDCRSLINMYRENSFTGRAVARIFYGIQSPNYPAVIWGRCKFWRSHMNADFNAICQIASREILQLR